MVTFQKHKSQLAMSQKFVPFDNSTVWVKFTEVKWKKDQSSSLHMRFKMPKFNNLERKQQMYASCFVLSLHLIEI